MIVNLNKDLYVNKNGILECIDRKKMNPILRLIEYLIKRTKTKKEAELEKEFNKEFNEEIRDDEDKIELTEEEKNDLDQIFDIIDGIGDRVAESVVFEYFKIKELRDGRANGKYE